MKMTGEQALEKLEKQIARQNEYNKVKYDRIGTTFRKGTRERIQALGYTLGEFLKESVYEKLDALEEIEEEPKEPPKQAHTDTKTSQVDILPYGSEKGLKEDRIKCKSVIVDVDGQEVELWLDQYNGVFDAADPMQFEAFRRWKASQMPKVEDVPKQELKKEEPEQTMQRIDETLLDILPEDVREKLKEKNNG